MDQADQGDRVDLDPGVQVDQVDQVDQVNLVILGPHVLVNHVYQGHGSKWVMQTKVTGWTQTPGSGLTRLTMLTWLTRSTCSTWVPVSWWTKWTQAPVPGGPGGPGN